MRARKVSPSAPVKILILINKLVEIISCLRIPEGLLFRLNLKKVGPPTSVSWQLTKKQTKKSKVIHTLYFHSGRCTVRDCDGGCWLSVERPQRVIDNCLRNRAQFATLHTYILTLSTQNGLHRLRDRKGVSEMLTKCSPIWLDWRQPCGIQYLKEKSILTGSKGNHVVFNT